MMRISLIGVFKVGLLGILLHGLSGQLLPLVQASQEERNSQIGADIGRISKILSGVADKARSGKFNKEELPAMAESCKTGRELLKIASLPDHLSNLKALNSACVDWGRAIAKGQFDPDALISFSDALASEIRQQHDYGIYFRMVGNQRDKNFEISRAADDLQSMTHTRSSWQFSDKIYSVLSAIRSI